MKRIIVAFLLILNIGIAYGASDKTITSKTYVDNQLATKQDKIRAIDDKTVITHTGSAGEIGEKGIYDSTNNYAEQQTSLVTAGDANTGINNALENEFVCVEFDTDSTCLLWKVKNTSPQRILPEGYTPVEYLQGNSSGTINTGLVFNSGTLRFSIEVNTKSLVSAGENDVIGNFTNNTVGPGFVAGVYCSFENYSCTSSDVGFFTWVSPKNLHYEGVSTNNWHILESEFAGNMMTLSVDGRTQSIQRTTYYNSSPIVLMGGSTSYKLSRSVVKIRNIKIWHNNQLVRNYVTAKNSNDAYGVYDLVNNTFTATTNGTALTGGPDLDVYIPSGN